MKLKTQNIAKTFFVFQIQIQMFLTNVEKDAARIAVALNGISTISTTQSFHTSKTWELLPTLFEKPALLPKAVP